MLRPLRARSWRRTLRPRARAARSGRFSELDADGDGGVDRAEFRALFSKRLNRSDGGAARGGGAKAPALSPSLSESDARDLFRIFDEARSGARAARSFSRARARARARARSGRTLRCCPRFCSRAVDQDGDGTISPRELRHVSAMLGRAVTDAELGRIMRAYDAAGDGVLSFAEFHAWIRGSEGGA